MPWRSPSRLRSEPGAAARQAPFAGGRLLTVMMLRGYYRPTAAAWPLSIPTARTVASYGQLPLIRLVASPLMADLGQTSVETHTSDWVLINTPDNQQCDRSVG